MGGGGKVRGIKERKVSDITDWNVREVKTPVEYVNSNLPPAGSKIISAFMSGEEAKSLTIPLLLEFCKNHARESGLEFRNIKEIGKLGEVMKGERKIDYTAEERKVSEENWRGTRCVHGLRHLETCLSCNDEIAKRLMGELGLDNVNSETGKRMELERNIDHPEYYNLGKIEVIDFIEDQKLGFHLGNVVKYMCREGKAKNKIERL